MSLPGGPGGPRSPFGPVHPEQSIEQSKFCPDILFDHSQINTLLNIRVVKIYLHVEYFYFPLIHLIVVNVLLILHFISINHQTLRLQHLGTSVVAEPNAV